jgi:Zn-dependent protease with chaperone function
VESQPPPHEESGKAQPSTAKPTTKANAPSEAASKSSAAPGEQPPAEMSAVRANLAAVVAEMDAAYGPPPTEVPAVETGNSVLRAVGNSGIDGIPAFYNDGTQWLRNGFKRHSGGTFFALIFGWTGVWLALWAAAAGLVLGALIAGGVGTGLAYHFGVGQAAGVIGAVLGGLVGMLYGAFAVLKYLFLHHELQTFFSILSGAVLALVIVVVIAAYERLGLRLRGYRRLSRMEVEYVAPLVKDVAERMDLPALPRFAMEDTVVANAYTHMRTVVFTKGLFQTLKVNEVRAIIAHELEHWRMGDAVGLRFVWAAAWPVALTYNLGMLLSGNRSGEVEKLRWPPTGIRILLGWLVAWPMWVIIKLVITPIVASRQRRYEYAADAAAAKIGYAADLSSALSKLGAFEGGRTGWERAMAATHPPTELRLERLKPLLPDDAQYQEDELRGPTGTELKRLLTFPHHARQTSNP